MKHLLICIAMLVPFVCFGQSTPSDQARKSDEIVMKMRQIDLLVQIIPLALTKDQINQILPSIERARSKAHAMEKDEAATLQKLDGKISDAIKKAIDTSVAPPRDLLDELAKTTMLMTEKRLVLIDENVDAVFKAFTGAINAGQKKAAANSLAPQLLDPTLKPDQMTEDDKVKFFVKNILLDDQAYDVLVQLAKHAS